MLGDGRAEALWVEQYRAFVRLPSARTGFGALYRDLAVEPHRPALVHCATGKDRTGGPPRRSSSCSTCRRRRSWTTSWKSRRHLGPLVEPFLAAFAARGGDPELLQPILNVRPGYLEAALDEVRREYGSIERYFSDGLDIDEATREVLRTAFTG